jgi:hypothetical protein
MVAFRFPADTNPFHIGEGTTRPAAVSPPACLHCLFGLIKDLEKDPATGSKVGDPGKVAEQKDGFVPPIRLATAPCDRGNSFVRMEFDSDT